MHPMQEAVANGFTIAFDPETSRSTIRVVDGVADNRVVRRVPIGIDLELQYNAQGVMCGVLVCNTEALQIVLKAIVKLPQDELAKPPRIVSDDTGQMSPATPTKMSIEA